MEMELCREVILEVRRRGAAGSARWRGCTPGESEHHFVASYRCFLCRGRECVPPSSQGVLGSCRWLEGRRRHTPHQAPHRPTRSAAAVRC